MSNRPTRFALLALLPALACPLHAQDTAISERIALGQLTFADNCRKCHQLDGYGEEALYPSLHRPSLLADKTMLIQTILHGRVAPPQAPDGQAQRLMPSLDFLSDGEIAALIAFITDSWGDEVLIVDEAEVARARQAMPR